MNPALTAKEARVLEMMKNGHRLWSVRYSRLYGLFEKNEFRRPVELVQLRVVESLKAKGMVTIGVVNSTSEYVLTDFQKGNTDATDQTE